MTSAVFVLLSLTVLGLSFYLFHRAAGVASIRTMNMMGVIFYYNFFLQSWIASVLVVNQWDNHYMISRIGTDDARLFGWLAINYTLLVFPIGMILANQVYSGKLSALRDYDRFLSTPTAGWLSRKDSALQLVLVLGLVLVTAALAYGLSQIGFIAVVEMLKGHSAESYAAMRIAASREFGGVVYIRNLLMLGLSVLLACVSFAHYLRSKTVASLMLFLGYLVVCTLALTYNFAKAPLLQLWICLGFVYLYHMGGVSWKVVGIMGGLVLSAIVLQYSVLSAGSISVSYDTGPIGRVILGQAAGTFLAFDYFGRLDGFLGFSSFSSLLAGLSGFESSERAARLLMEYYNPAGVERGIAGVMNTLFVAEAWANFGLFGVIFSPIYVGFLIQLLFLVLIRMRKSALTVGVLGFFSFGGAVTGGFNDYLYNPVFVFLLSCLILAWFCARFLMELGAIRRAMG